MSNDREGADIQPDIQLVHARCMSQDTLDALHDAVGIYRTDGVLTAYNETFREFWKIPPEISIVGKVNLFEAAGVHPDDVIRLHAAVAGERGVSTPHEIDLRDDPAFEQLNRKQVWMQTRFAPLRVDGVVRFVMITFEDCTEEILDKQHIEQSMAQLAAQQATIEALQSAQEQIRQQQDTIRELSVPIIEVWPHVLTMPLVGHIDERRASDMTERLLARLVTHQARYVIVDLTGVERLDEGTAEHVLRMLRAVPLLGVEPIITGIHPQVARAIIMLGLDMATVRTLGTLRGALAEILAVRTREKEPKENRPSKGGFTRK